MLEKSCIKNRLTHFQFSKRKNCLPEMALNPRSQPRNKLKLGTEVRKGSAITALGLSTSSVNSCSQPKLERQHQNLKHALGQQAARDFTIS